MSASASASSSSSSSSSPHWVAFLARLGEVVEQDDGSVLAHCPCPLHGGKGSDMNPSLKAFCSDEDVIVLKCRVGCPTLGVLKALGLSYGSLYPAGGDGNQPALSQDDYALRSEVYEALLSALPLHQIRL